MLQAGIHILYNCFVLLYFYCCSKSQFRDEYSLDQILSSPKVYGPLTKLQCCPTSDGAAAAIIVSERFVRRQGLEAQAVEILAMEMVTDMDSTFGERSAIKLVGYDMTKAAAERVFSKTKRRPSDVQVRASLTQLVINVMARYFIKHLFSIALIVFNFIT